jgi:DNA-binding HxlR family transcriptional regulator
MQSVKRKTQAVFSDFMQMMSTTDQHRSGCPINLAVEVFGDKWSLVVLRDMMFGNRRYFRELLLLSDEGISSNILSDRLKSLLDSGMISKVDDPRHKQKSIYSLTEKSIALVPIFAQIGAWGRRYLPVTEELSIRAQLLEEGGPKLWDAFMDELRETHLGIAMRKGRPRVSEQLRAAYEEVVARNKRKAAKR